MKKPNRHATHVLEAVSERFFRNQLPVDWFVDKPDHDYGIDLVANIVVSGEVTGLNFSVQLKAQEKSSTSDFVSVTLKNSTLRLYDSRLEPVLIAVYVHQQKETYWIWYNDLILDKGSVSRTTSIKLPKVNKLSTTDWEAVRKYVQEIFSLKKLIDGIRTLEYEEISQTEILAWRYYYAGDYEKASFYFKSGVDQEPKNASLILEGLAHSLYMCHRYKEALFFINQVIEGSGTASQLLTKACILAEDGAATDNKAKLLEAKDIFKKFLHFRDSRPIYQFNYANTLRSLGDPKGAIKHFLLCLKIDPTYAEAWKNLGSTYYSTGNHKEELVCYNKALSLNPNLPEALFSKGVTLCHIYHRYKDGLNLLTRAVQIDEGLVIHAPRGYFWFALAYEKLNNLKEALYYLHKGLSLAPEDGYLLNFKGTLLATYWTKEPWIKREALCFFRYHLELTNDYRSLYFLLTIQGAQPSKALCMIKKHAPILKDTGLIVLQSCGIDIKLYLPFLLTYDKYVDMRRAHPIIRYTDHLISEHFTISSSFWELLDLTYARAFYLAVEDADHTLPNELGKKILKGLSDTPNLIAALIPDGRYSQDQSIQIMANLYLEFPLIVIREFGIQLGFIASKLGLKKIDPDRIMSKKWLNELQENVMIQINQKLKLFPAN